MKIFKVLMVFVLSTGLTIGLATPSQGVVNAWSKKSYARPIVQKPVVHKQVAKSKKISMQDFVTKKLNDFFKQRRTELNDLTILSKDSSFDFLVSSNEKDFAVITNHNQSLDDLIKNKKIWIRFGRISFTELGENRGAPKDIRIFTTKDAVGKFRSGVISNLAVLSTLKPIADSKDYLNQKGECGERNKPSTSGASQSGDRLRNQLNRQGQYMDDGARDPDRVWSDESGIHAEYHHEGGVHEIVTMDDSGRVTDVTLQDVDSGAGETTVFARRDPPITQQGGAKTKEKKEEEKKETEPATETTPEATPESEPEPEGAVTDLDDVTPLEDVGGGNLFSFCNGLAGSMAQQQCRKQVRDKIFGNDDSLVLKEDSSGASVGYRFQGHNLQSRSAHNTHVGFNDPYIIPTDEGGRGGHSALGADGCGGGVVRGSIVGTTFCYRAEGGDSRCDDGSGGGLPDVPGGGTAPGDKPIPNPGPGPRLGR